MIWCYYPTTTITIDDDSNFLSALTTHLDSSNYITFTSPQNALTAIDKENSHQRLRSRVIKPLNSNDFNHTSPEDSVIHINLHKLHEEIYNSKRFHDVSVFIIDYYMDDMNGIEVCEALKDHPARKILLTGGIDKEKIAIQAFNQGIIHRFINKSDPNFITKLNQAVTVAKEAYFRGFTESLLQTIPLSSIKTLQHPAYINLVNKLRNQYEIIEYYLIDTNGSTLMLDEHGKALWLIIKSESDLTGYHDIAVDQEAPKHITMGLANRSLLPFFFSRDDYLCLPTAWDNYFHTCQPLPGTKNYYAVIENNDAGHINHDRVYPFTGHQQAIKVNHEVLL